MALQTHLYFAYQTNLFWKFFIEGLLSFINQSLHHLGGELIDEQILIQILKIGIVLKVSKTVDRSILLIIVHTIHLNCLKSSSPHHFFPSPSFPSVEKFSTMVFCALISPFNFMPFFDHHLGVSQLEHPWEIFLAQMSRMVRAGTHPTVFSSDWVLLVSLEILNLLHVYLLS